VYYLFVELIQVALGNRDNLSRVPTRKEWISIYQESEKQSILGIMLDGIELLSKSQHPPQDILLQWIGLVQMIEQNTIKISQASEEVVKYFQEKGFGCTLLKGTAIGSYYLHPNRRQSGDIDIWLNGGRKIIYEFARKFYKDGKLYGVNYHHIHFHIIKDVYIEVHIWPSFLSSPLRNWRLHKFFNIYSPSIETCMPSIAFDRVFILLHCYRHFCGHGVGLRQIMDYYYVLHQGFSEEEKQDSVYWIKKLGMERFAAGVMWIMQAVIGLEKKFMLVEPDEKEGQFILNEIFYTGNMGHYDKRNWGSLKTPMSRFVYSLRRDVFFMGHYPQEVLWKPFFSVWLFFNQKFIWK